MIDLVPLSLDYPEKDKKVLVKTREGFYIQARYVTYELDSFFIFDLPLPGYSKNDMNEIFEEVVAWTYL